jgi:hypothetical protein
LGGSFGIAASTAILGVIEGRDLRDIISPSQLTALNISSLDATKDQAVRQAYAHAFNHSLRISTIISGSSIIFALLSYQKRPMTLAERTEQQIAFETTRQIAKHRSLAGAMGNTGREMQKS